MQFIHPAFFYLALLAIIPIVLYFFRRRSKTVAVSTLVFFKTLAREHQESAWLRRMKKLLSLLLTLLMLAALVLALVRVVFAPRVDDINSVVILLDRSASMAAVDGDGKTRLQIAKDEIRVRLAGLPEVIGVCLIVFDGRAEVLLPRTLKRRELLSRLDQIEVRPIAQNLAAAMETAMVIAQLEKPSVIWQVSDSAPLRVDDGGEEEDGGGDGGGEVEVEVEVGKEGEVGRGEVDGVVLPEGVSLQWVDVRAAEMVNVGFTSFQVRPIPMQAGKFEAYVKVACNAAAKSTVKTQLEVNLAGMPLQLRELELEPGASVSLIIPIEGSEQQMLRLELRTEGDQLAVDDQVVYPLPESRAMVVAWITPQADPFTEIALSAIQEEGQLDLWKGGPDVWPLSEQVDVVIFDGWLPEEWPEDLPVIVMNPPGDSGPLHARSVGAAGIPYESVRVGNQQHPVLFRVSSSRVAVTQTSIYEVEGGSLQPLWLAGNEAILSAGEVRGQRMVVMGFSPGRSEYLPLTASFPLLMGNAIFWCAERSQAVVERVRENHSGDLIEIAGDEVGDELLWSDWRDGQWREYRQAMNGSLVELGRTGMWRSADGQRGVAHLLSGNETDVAAVGAEQQRASSGLAADRVQGRWGDVGRWILMVLVGLLVVESWLFHRHAVY
ncbi:MAG: BatA and WFA domain-containing protein [Verrucomicrobiales bacterium]|nr:BatA and WFA domain-containing protein [Verrucomicrobiales bacterium]